MKIGEHVRHRSRLDCGIGRITEIDEDCCSADFSTQCFSGISLQALESVEDQVRDANERERNRGVLLSAVNELFERDFLHADRRFADIKKDFFSIDDYLIAKQNFVQGWLEKNGGIYLDSEQASAVFAVDQHTQVVARAGSGKTSTLVSRAYFLQKHCGVKPSEMMLLAFNKKAAEEMEHRLVKLLDGQPPYVMTFHALAHALVHSDQNLIHDSSDGKNQALSSFVQAVINDRLRNPEFVVRIRKVMVAHFQEDWDRIEDGGYHLSKEDMLAYRRSLKRETLHGEFVKSFGEKVIANFMFEHQVSYLYEPSERGWLKNYHPDFILKRGDGTGVAIEYFGMAGDPDYDDMSAKKRRYWQAKPGWALIECSPADIRSNGVEGFLQKLQITLEDNGFVFRRMSEDEIWHQIATRAIDRFTAATRSFIARCRKLELTPESLRQSIITHKTKWQVEADFLDIMAPIYADYLERLVIEDKEDFDGLMHRATVELNGGKTSFSRFMKKQHGDLANLRFMLIDEYQDFSKLFHSMIEAIRGRNPDLQLFCVGDDWQAINGFAGSDLGYYENFSSYFPDSERLHISTNYRSAAGIVAIGNVVMAERDKQGKPALAHSVEAGNVWLADVSNFSHSPNEQARHGDDSITPMVLRLTSQTLERGKDIVLLSRTNNPPGFINYKAQQGNDDNSQEIGIKRFGKLICSYFPEHQRPRIKVSTAHGFKGLQGSVVVVLDAVAGCYPLIHQDWIFLRLLGESVGSITDEARRLFYVALTRAVDTLVIFTERNKKSPFLEDVEKQIKLAPIFWGALPPVSAKSDRLKVFVGNLPYRGSKPTKDIKDFLKQEGYSQSKLEGIGFCWLRTFAQEGFSIDEIRNSTWSGNADGVEVRILDEQDKLVENYKIDRGVWTELMPSGLQG